MPEIRLLIVDDHAVFRDGLRALFERQPDLVVAGEAGDAAGAVRLAGELQPDVVVMDLNLPHSDAIEATRQIVAERPAVKVLALSAYDDVEGVTGMIQAGAQGYLLKSSPTAELIGGIRAVAAGGAAIDPAIAPRVVQHYRRMAELAQQGLSDRDLTLLRLLAAGDSAQQIARELCISRQTVGKLLARIYTRLGVSTRTEAVAVALARGLI